MPLPNQKSTAKNYVAADSEMGSQTLCRCRFRNRHKNCVAADSEISSDDGVISALLLLLF
jgi:hypothetical protein